MFCPILNTFSVKSEIFGVDIGKERKKHSPDIELVHVFVYWGLGSSRTYYLAPIAYNLVT